MTTMTRRKTTILALFGLFYFTASPVAGAVETDQAISVTPAIFEKTVEPGSVTEQAVFITNPGLTAKSVTAYTKAFVPNETVPKEYLKTYDTARWVDINEPDFILRAGERRLVTFSITVPKDAEPGGHYATLYLEQLVPAAPTTQKKVTATPRLGVLVFLTVKGNIKEKLTRSGFDVPRVSESGPIDLKIKLKNEGNVHILPTGSMYIYDDRGKQVDKLPLQPGMVLPHTEREFSVKWDKPSLFGKYTARAEITYGTPQSKLESREIEFWVIPWIKTLVIIFVIIVLILFFMRTNHHWRRAWEAFNSPERRFRRMRRRQ